MTPFPRPCLYETSTPSAIALRIIHSLTPISFAA